MKTSKNLAFFLIILCIFILNSILVVAMQTRQDSMNQQSRQESTNQQTRQDSINQQTRQDSIGQKSRQESSNQVTKQESINQMTKQEQLLNTTTINNAKENTKYGLDKIRYWFEGVFNNIISFFHKN